MRLSLDVERLERRSSSEISEESDTFPRLMYFYIAKNLLFETELVHY